jgi:hypothetical protein
MPTTLTGPLLFVILLLPCFAYLVGKETQRHLNDWYPHSARPWQSLPPATPPN